MAEIQKALALNRRIDELVLTKLGRKPDEIPSLSMEHILPVFNELLGQQTLSNYVELEGMKFRPDMKDLFHAVHEATVYGKKYDSSLVRKLNRALLFSLYIQNYAQIRKYERLETVALLKSSVTLKPLPPFFGETISGMLVNLSAGGMALILNEKIQPGTKMVLKATFPDRTSLQNEVVIKHEITTNGQKVHGFEFVDLPNFRVEKFNKMSKDNAECDGRIERDEKEICFFQCSFYTICKKPQKKHQ